MKTRLGPMLISLLAGAIYPLGFEPIGWWPLALLSVAVAFHLWSSLPHRAALWSAVWYGMGLYGVGVSWVYVSMVNFGNMLPVMAVVAVILFALFLSLYFILLVGVFKLLASRLQQTQQLTVLLPVLWAVSEALRGTLFTGFAWLFLGYAGTDTWFSSWATLGGVLAVSFVLAWISGAGVCLFQSWRGSGKLSYRPVKTIFMFALLTGISLGLGAVRWTEPDGVRAEVSLIQADISLSDKWRPENRDNLVQTYLAASRAIDDADLIVWPEAALPMVLDQVPGPYLEQIRSLDAALVFGVVDREGVDNEVNLYNGLAAIDSGYEQDSLVQVYHKRHLVPFGEFFPLKPLLGWLFESLAIPMSDFVSGGSEQGNIRVAGLVLVPTICYEDAYPEDWRRQVAESSAILNISEDAWFGDSFAPHQRLQMARMRAIEFQRPVIRVSNSGLSTVIDDYGEVDAVSPQFQPALFSAPVFGMQGETPYTRYGRYLLWGWLGLCLVYAGFRHASIRETT